MEDELEAAMMTFCEGMGLGDVAGGTDCDSA